MLREQPKLTVWPGCPTLQTMQDVSRRSADNQDISVIVAYQHTLLREGITALLRDAGFNVIGQAGSAVALCQIVAVDDPDVILLDWEFPEGALEVIRVLADEASTAAIVVLMRPQATGAFSHVVQTGASGYLSVNLSGEEFIHSMRMLARGDFVVSREMADALKDELISESTKQPKEGLSDREREVINLLARGATNREIAQRLTITENTVKVHLRRILDKLNLRNRQQAAAYAVQEGLLEQDVEQPSEEPTL